RGDVGDPGVVVDPDVLAATGRRTDGPRGDGRRAQGARGRRGAHPRLRGQPALRALPRSSGLSVSEPGALALEGLRDGKPARSVPREGLRRRVRRPRLLASLAPAGARGGPDPRALSVAARSERARAAKARR